MSGRLTQDTKLSRNCPDSQNNLRPNYINMLDWPSSFASLWSWWWWYWIVSRGSFESKHMWWDTTLPPPHLQPSLVLLFVLWMELMVGLLYCKLHAIYLLWDAYCCLVPWYWSQFTVENVCAWVRVMYLCVHSNLNQLLWFYQQLWWQKKREKG